jgi:hypothetical protein
MSPHARSPGRNAGREEAAQRAQPHAGHHTRAAERRTPPQDLRRFLTDDHVMFAAYNVASDCRKLRAYHGLEVASYPASVRAIEVVVLQGDTTSCRPQRWRPCPASVRAIKVIVLQGVTAIKTLRTRSANLWSSSSCFL